jgi:ceramide glucosyltransferase
MLHILPVLSLVVWALALSLTLFSAYLALKHFSRAAPHLDLPFALFPVSILKPLKGSDEGLFENLESSFLLDYPEYELIFSVADERDTATSVVRKLMARYPRTRAKLIVGDVEVGTNPKVNNLIRSYAGAAHDWLLISDSNVRLAPDYLRKMMAHIENGVGMVTSVVSGNGAEGVGGCLESVYLNTVYARGMILTAALGRPCVMGKSMLFQRSTADRFGGLKTLACYLAEDYMAGEAIRKLGLKVVVASEPVRQIVGSHSIGAFWSRHLRWGRIRKAQAPLAFLIEPWLGCLLSGWVGASAISPHFRAAFFLTHLFIWSTCDIMVVLKIKTKI